MSGGTHVSSLSLARLHDVGLRLYDVHLVVPYAF
jgi:hypothetical protein